MGGQDKLPDDGRSRTQARNDNAPEPRAEGGETPAPGTYPPVRKDDSIQVAEDRSFVGEGPAKPGSEERDDEVDPSVSHGGADSNEDDPDAR